MRETRQSGSEGGGTKSIASPYPYKVMTTLRVDKVLIPRSLSLSLRLRRAEACRTSEVVISARKTTAVVFAGRRPAGSRRQLRPRKSAARSTRSRFGKSRPAYRDAQSERRCYSRDSVD